MSCGYGPLSVPIRARPSILSLCGSPKSARAHSCADTNNALPSPDHSSWLVKEPLKNSLRTQSFRLVRNLGAILKVYVHPSKKRNNECGPAWKTRRARPEAHICCALPLGKGTTLTIETRHNSCTLQATLSMQGVFQRFLNPSGLRTIGANPVGDSSDKSI